MTQATTNQMEAYRARVRAFLANMSEAERAHRAELRRHSDAVRAQMLADPRYHD